jgi:hypothetical protein
MLLVSKGALFKAGVWYVAVFEVPRQGVWRVATSEV